MTTEDGMSVRVARRMGRGKRMHTLFTPHVWAFMTKTQAVQTHP
jgi:hypothetical protein